MTLHWNGREQLSLARFLLRWLILTVPLGLLVGSAVALFLASLDYVTQLRWDHPWLILLLPACGVAVALLYQKVGQAAEAGNNLILDQIHRPGGGVPLRMAPLVLIGTLLTHLGGGSAGREGTAVQMGGSLAAALGRVLRLGPADLRLLLMAGVAAGFGAVFGTPLAGAVFALEVLAIGRLSYEALVPCLAAALIGDSVTSAWGIHHTDYHITDWTQGQAARPGIDWWLAGQVLLGACAFGGVSVLFAEVSHGLQQLTRTWIRWPLLRPLVGGTLVLLLIPVVGGTDYLGLGVTADPAHPDAVTIQSCFQARGADWFSWWWKLVFTAVTVSSGFKGGEVTPLFFIGAALGNVTARLIGAPVDLFAALGFVAVFAGATHTPLACTLMAIELFGLRNPGVMGAGFAVYAALACFLAHFLNGHSGIYLSQQSRWSGFPGGGLVASPTLRELRSASPPASATSDEPAGNE